MEGLYNIASCYTLGVALQQLKVRSLLLYESTHKGSMVKIGLQLLQMLAIFVILLITCAAPLPLRDFYEFGPDAGDTVLARNDDDSQLVSFPSEFNIFGMYWRIMSVSHNVITVYYTCS